MAVMVVSPREVAQGVFRYLGLSIGQGNADETGVVNPSRLAELVRHNALTETEIEALWCYVATIAQMNGALGPKAKEIRQTLGVDPAFVDLWDQAASGFLAQQAGAMKIDDVALRPPVALSNLVIKTVAAFQAPTRLNKKKLGGLESGAFEHIGDRMFLTKFHAIPGTKSILGHYLDTVHKRPLEISLIAGSFRVTPSSLPWLSDCYLQACETLDVRKPPELFVAHGGLNASTTGAEEPIIIVNTGMLNLLDRQELTYVLGHELGHVMAGHVKYHMLANWVVGAAAAISTATLGLGGLILTPTIVAALYAWLRRAEYTADRAGLLACQDREVALRANLKCIGYPPRFYDRIRTRPVLEQVAYYQERLAGSSFDRLLDLNDVWGQGHPRGMMRVSELLDWCDEGGYAEILEANPQQLKVIAQRMRDDPMLQELTVTACRELTTWAAERFQVPRKLCGPIVRRMLNEQLPPTGTPLERILRVELIITKESANQVLYALTLLVNNDGKPVKTNLPLPLDASWDSVPATLREELIRSGEAQSVRLLYTCG